MKAQIQTIKKQYGKKQVLTSVTFDVNQGECIGILGANGSGKSTLLSILAGVQKPDSGAFLWEGENLFAAPKKREKLVGYVPQGTPLVEELTAKDNLRLWYTKREMEESLEKGVLQLLGVEEFLKVPVSKLSGGMKKRLSIGCALVKNPGLLIMDEPMAALDLVCKQNIASLIESHKKAGGMAILATHDAFEISLCTRLFILKNGTLTPYEYHGDPESLVSRL